ncbi:MAG: ribosome maturation factor RimM [Acetivibrionales bacterium]|jgi:16S rRNA processing protein RimM
MYEYLEIGKIINTRGIKGELKVIPLTDNPERFNELEWVYVRNNDSIRKYFVDRVNYFKGFVYLKFKGLNDIETAKQLKDLYILIDRKNAVRLPEDTYFICDLIDLEVFENNKLLGRLKDVLRTGSNDVYVVKGERGAEILVPALKSVVKKVDIENRRIDVYLPEGLV